MIEPVFADTKFNRRIDRFQRRGRAAARSEWRLITATHNLLKLWRHTSAPRRPDGAAAAAHASAEAPASRRPPSRRAPTFRNSLRAKRHSAVSCRWQANAGRVQVASPQSLISPTEGPRSERRPVIHVPALGMVTEHFSFDRASRGGCDAADSWPARYRSCGIS